MRQSSEPPWFKSFTMLMYSIYISLDVACAERSVGQTIEAINSKKNEKKNERKDGKTSFVFLISLNTFSSAPFHIITLFIVHGRHIYYFPFHVFTSLCHSYMLSQAIQHTSNPIG